MRAEIERTVEVAMVDVAAWAVLAVERSVLHSPKQARMACQIGMMQVGPVCSVPVARSSADAYLLLLGEASDYL